MKFDESIRHLILRAERQALAWDRAAGARIAQDYQVLPTPKGQLATLRCYCSPADHTPLARPRYVGDDDEWNVETAEVLSWDD